MEINSITNRALCSKDTNTDFLLLGNSMFIKIAIHIVVRIFVVWKKQRTPEIASLGIWVNR